MARRTFFRRTVAVPQDHGTWVVILSPLLIGLFAGRNFAAGWLALTLAALTVFLIRQPVTILVKAYSGRRPRTDLPATWYWIAIYGAVLSLATLRSILSGYSFVLYLALPGLPIFAWHLFLVSRRKERRQAGLEILASGVLSLAAPAAFWVRLGSCDRPGGWLWILSWLQSAASMLYACLRLEQRDPAQVPPRKDRLRMGRRAGFSTSFNLLANLILSFLRILPELIFLPYLIQWLETAWGIMTLTSARNRSRSGCGSLQQARSSPGCIY